MSPGRKMPFPPQDFPQQLWEETEKHVSDPFRENPNQALFVGAWNGVRYRYAAMVEFSDLYTDSFNAHGAGPPEPARFAQERDLFGFASAAYSMFDCFHFALFSIGALLAPSEFKLESESDEQKIRFSYTRKTFAKAFPNDPILADFDVFRDDGAQKDLSALRNMYTHRASLPRHHQMGDDTKPPAQLARLNIAIDGETTSTRCKEAHRLLSQCLTSASTFVQRQIPDAKPTSGSGS
jgi:hypothetical protein